MRKKICFALSIMLMLLAFNQNIVLAKEVPDDVISYYLDMYEIEREELTDLKIVNVSPTSQRKTNMMSMLNDTSKEAIAIIAEKNSDGTVYSDVILLVPNAKTKSPYQTFAGESTTINNNLLSIHGTAVYNLYSDGVLTHPKYFSPYGCYFRYTKGSASTVSRISVDYICDGIVYSYPGFVNSGKEETHIVSVDRANPIAGTIYTNTNYYNSNKVLYCFAGSPFVGNFLTFEFVADGKKEAYTVVLQSNP